MQRGVGLLVGWICVSGCSYTPTSLAPPDARPIDGPVDVPIDGPGRVRANLIAFYEFNDIPGTTITDTSGSAPVNLVIQDMTMVTWGNGELEVNTTGVVQIATMGAAARIDTECRASDELTVEAWVKPSLTDQTGGSGQPSRVVTMSINAGARNFALGQQGTEWAAQIVTSAAPTGSPTLTGGTASTIDFTQIALTSDATSRRLYVNGQEQTSDTNGGLLDSWTGNLKLAFGAEPSLNNDWRGSIAMIAIYDAALSQPQLQVNYDQGKDAR